MGLRRGVGALLDPRALLRRQARLNERGEPSRLERIGSPTRELALYHDAYDFLDRCGWRQIKVNCRGLHTRDPTEPGEIALF